MSLRELYRDPFQMGNWWSGYDRPARIFDQNFGIGLFDDDLPLVCRGMYVRPRRSNNKESGVSEVVNNKEKFEVMLDVKQFTPEELKVKTVDNFVVIEGKHEERADEHGLITRQFTRKYLLPEDVRADSVNCAFSTDGVLTVTASRILPETKEERQIQIQMTGGPALSRATSNTKPEANAQAGTTAGKETKIPVTTQ